MIIHYAYLDTSFIVPLYIKERGSEAVSRAATEVSNGGKTPLLISELTYTELYSAVSKNIRTGIIDKEEAKEIIASFEQFNAKNLFLLPVKSSDFKTAREFIARMDTSLRSLDALHLAIAHTNNCTLLTADKQLAAAASVLEVDNYFVSYS